jgi:hypothetical protein
MSIRVENAVVLNVHNHVSIMMFLSITQGKYELIHFTIVYFADVNTRTSKSFDGDHIIGISHSPKSYLLATQIK